MKLFKNVAIIGVGLLGGSIGLAIKKKRLAGKVVGFFRHKNKIARALKTGAIDEGTDDFAKAVQDADFIILCSPIHDIIGKLKLLKKRHRPSALITDIGSTKSEIVKAGRGLNFIGSHPLAGSEQSGIGFAKQDLFKNSLCILTPTKNAAPHSLGRLAQFWKHLGAKTVILDSKKHDRILAYISHMPHSIAFSLMNAIASPMTSFAARALKDMTRITLSPANIWMDIFVSNQKEILKSIADFEKSLKQFKKALSQNDLKKLKILLTRARSKRQRIPSNSWDP